LHSRLVPDTGRTDREEQALSACVYMCVHVCMCVHMCMCVHVCICVCMCVHVCMCVCAYVCVCVCMCVYVRVTVNCLMQCPVDSNNPPR